MKGGSSAGGGRHDERSREGSPAQERSNAGGRAEAARSSSRPTSDGARSCSPPPGDGARPPSRPPRRDLPNLRRDPRREIEEELAFHLEERVREYVAQGMDSEEARAAAAERLGELSGVREDCARMLAAERRSAARRERAFFSWLDVRLGFRLLLRYPGLTVVGGLAMAFAIAVGAAAFEVVKQYVAPSLPLPDGGRIVAIRNLDTRVVEVRRPSSADFLSWRDALQRVEDVGAFRTLRRNLMVVEGDARPVVAAEISASAFRVTRTPPLLGRTLIDADETVGAPAVAVIGHELWQERFGGDPGAVGRVVRLGTVETTVVGVMPEGFAFPLAHALWTPLRVSASGAGTVEGGFGGALYVFGRLADGANMAGARAELEAVGARAAAFAPETGGRLIPEVVPFARDVLPLDVPHGMEPLVYAVNLFFVLLLVLVCANVALLMFARAVSRESEIVVRSAMGASRGRIVGQLFAEALVLGACAALTGLWAARVALAGLLRVLELESGGRVPFWFDARIAPTTVVYTVALTLLGAGVAGVVPALRMTGRGVGEHLRKLAAGAGGPRFGRAWTAVVVAQVAITVAFPSAAFFAYRYVRGIQTIAPGFEAREYLSLELALDPVAAEETDAGAAGLGALARELAERVASEPGVRGVTLSSALPRTVHPELHAEVDEGPAAAALSHLGHPVTLARVDADYFDVLGVAVLAGRGFGPGDVDSAAGPGAAPLAGQSLTSAATDAGDDPVSGDPVVVNRSFVARVLGGSSAIGRRVRFEGDGPRPWFEIVGVVPDLGTVSDDPQNLAAVYHPLPREAAPRFMIVHASGGPEALAPRVRALAAAVDPSLQLDDILPLDEVGASLWLELQYVFRILAGLSAVALLLSLAGIYATTAFAVARRRREIGIRLALGARVRSVLWSTFSGPVKQVGVGVFFGACLTAAVAYGIMRQALWPIGVLWVAAYALLMMGVCILACAVPTRRALAIEPSEALRMEG